MEDGGRDVRGLRRRARPRRRRRRASRVWSCADFVDWNGIRRNLMFDPRYHAVQRRARRPPPRRHPPVLRRTSRSRRAPPDDHGPAIRRWEMFSIAPDAPAVARERTLAAPMRDCDRFIPGITRCAIGTNMADGPIELVWETTYESVGAYATTYMTHPYHAALLDRFLLPDCPERITTTNDFGAGLIGYTVDRDRPLGPVAVRRLLLLDFDDDPRSAPGAGRRHRGDRRRLERLDPGRQHHGDPLVRRRDRPRRAPRMEPPLGPVLRAPSSSTRRTAGAPAAAAAIEAGAAAGRRSAEVVYVPEGRLRPPQAPAPGALASGGTGDRSSPRGDRGRRRCRAGSSSSPRSTGRVIPAPGWRR